MVNNIIEQRWTKHKSTGQSLPFGLHEIRFNTVVNKRIIYTLISTQFQINEINDRLVRYSAYV